MEQEFYVIAFETTHYAIMAEKRLKEKFPVDMIPTPRVITASCGLSLKFRSDVVDDIVSELKTWDIDWNLLKMYRYQKENGECQAFPCENLLPLS